MSEEIKTNKKPWFNRIWSAVTGLVIGIAAMFGISTSQISDIKNDAKEAYAKIQEIQACIEEKDYVSVIKAANDAAKSIKQIIGEVKETTDEAKESYNFYKNSIEEIKTAMNAKDYKKASDNATKLLAKLVEKVPADQLTGVEEKIYKILEGFVKSINEGKYDDANELLNGKEVLVIPPIPSVPTVTETPTVPEVK